MSMIDCGCDMEATLYGKPKPYYCARHKAVLDEEADVNDYKGELSGKTHKWADIKHKSEHDPAPLSPERRYENYPSTSTGVVTSVPYLGCMDGFGNTFEFPEGTMITGGHFVPTGIGGAPTRATTLPTGGAERKQFPIASGVLDYFPDALVAVANVSWVGNEQHNPGQPLHWARGKSTDESDTMIRHFLQRGSLDTDGQRHSAKMVWRALAILQKEIEQEKGQ